MSYNILSGNLDFVGEALGLVEDLVNNHGAQSISGAKTFTNITASGDNGVGLVVAGDLSIDASLVHTGDDDTEINFTTDTIKLIPGQVTLATLSKPGGAQGHVSFNDGGADVDFNIYGDSGNRKFGFNGEYEVFAIGHGARQQRRNL